MDFHQINYFLAAANYLNLTKAASDLFITQPALSKQIAAIEAELDLQLFVRGKSGLLLTPAGQVLQEGLPKCIDIYQETINKAKNAYRGYRGHLTIAVLDAYPLPERLAEALIYTHKQFAEIKVDLIRRGYRNLLEGLKDKSMDIGVVFGSEFPLQPDLEALPLSSDKMALFYSTLHPLANKEKVQFSDMRDEVFIIPEGFESGIKMLTDTAREIGFEPKIEIVRNFVDMALNVEVGAGIGITSENSSLLHSPYMIQAPPPPNFHQVESLVWNKTNENLSLTCFINIIKESPQNFVE